MMMTIFFLARFGSSSFRGAVVLLLLIALVSLIVAIWPSKSGTK
jgi:uncharacterized membrane protein